MRVLEKEIKRVRVRNILSGSHIPLFESLIIFIGPESDHWECLSLTN